MHTTDRNAIEGRSWHDQATLSLTPPISYASYGRNILRLYPENPDIGHAETMDSAMKVLNTNSTREEGGGGWGVKKENSSQVYAVYSTKAVRLRSVQHVQIPK